MRNANPLLAFVRKLNARRGCHWALLEKLIVGLLILRYSHPLLWMRGTARRFLREESRLLARCITASKAARAERRDRILHPERYLGRE